MIPGLLAAAGYERSDTNYTAVKGSDSVNFTYNGKTFSGGSGTTPSAVTLQIGEPTDTRYIMVGCIGIDATQQNNGFSSLLINGTSAQNFAATTQNLNVGTESLFSCVGSLRVNTGTTCTAQVTLNLTGGGLIYFWWAKFDCGIIPPYFTTGSDTTPDGSGVLSVSDMGNKSSALVVAAWEDDPNAIASVAWSADPSSEGLTREISQESNAADPGAIFAEAVLVNGPPSENFPIRATPDTYNSGDVAVLQYITAHYS